MAVSESIQVATAVALADSQVGQQSIRMEQRVAVAAE